MDRAIRTSLLVLALSLFAPLAYGYLDSGTGAMILQVVAGGVAGAAVMVKMFWHRIKGIFGGRKVQDDDPPA